MRNPRVGSPSSHAPPPSFASEQAHQVCMSIFAADEDVAGVPEFWLTIFKNVDLLADMVQEHDEPILKHLEDIQLDLQRENPMVRVGCSFYQSLSVAIHAFS